MVRLIKIHRSSCECNLISPLSLVIFFASCAYNTPALANTGFVNNLASPDEWPTGLRLNVQGTETKYSGSDDRTVRTYKNVLIFKNGMFRESLSVFADTGSQAGLRNETAVSRSRDNARWLRWDLREGSQLDNKSAVLISAGEPVPAPNRFTLGAGIGFWGPFSSLRAPRHEGAFTADTDSIRMLVGAKDHSDFQVQSDPQSDIHTFRADPAHANMVTLYRRYPPDRTWREESEVLQAVHHDGHWFPRKIRYRRWISESTGDRLVIERTLDIAVTVPESPPPDDLFYFDLAGRDIVDHVGGTSSLEQERIFSQAVSNISYSATPRSVDLGVNNQTHPKPKAGPPRLANISSSTAPTPTESLASASTLPPPRNDAYRIIAVWALGLFVLLTAAMIVHQKRMANHQMNH
ncbi:MAG: hypothetical protein AAF333_01005 [Planctomycetota bacterium]